MARHRFRKARTRRARGGFRTFARRARRSAKSYLNPLSAALYGAGYGAGREYVVAAAAPIVNMIPAGEYKDEVFMALAGYAAAKWGRGIVKNIGMTALTVEGYRAAAQAIPKASPAATSW